METRILFFEVELESAFGNIVAYFSEKGDLGALGWSDGEGGRKRVLEGLPKQARVQTGRREDRERAASWAGALWEGGQPAELNIAPSGSSFQMRVWELIRRIPRGQTRTYAELASDLGLGRGGSQAVGAATGANPLALVIPCHRVVGSGGELRGFAYGSERKRALLEYEGALPPSLFGGGAAFFARHK